MRAGEEANVCQFGGKTFLLIPHAALDQGGEVVELILAVEPEFLFIRIDLIVFKLLLPVLVRVLIRVIIRVIVRVLIRVLIRILICILVRVPVCVLVCVLVCVSSMAGSTVCTSPFFNDGVAGAAAFFIFLLQPCPAAGLALGMSVELRV